MSNQKERSQDDSSLADDEYTVLGGMEFDGEMEANEDTIMEDKDDFTPTDGIYLWVFDLVTAKASSLCLSFIIIF